MQCCVHQSLHGPLKYGLCCSKHSQMDKSLLHMFVFSSNKILNNIVFQKIKGFVQNVISICLKYFVLIMLKLLCLIKHFNVVLDQLIRKISNEHFWKIRIHENLLQIY